MRISDWSSDVCSSDLTIAYLLHQLCVDCSLDFTDFKFQRGLYFFVGTLNSFTNSKSTFASFLLAATAISMLLLNLVGVGNDFHLLQIGCASCGERVCQSVSISVVAVSLKTKLK